MPSAQGAAGVQDAAFQAPLPCLRGIFERNAAAAAAAAWFPLATSGKKLLRQRLHFQREEVLQASKEEECLIEHDDRTGKGAGEV